MEKIGLVLSGGGAKGAYQVGVMQALEELGLASSVSSISGASIGSLNACLFLQYPITDIIYIWKNLKWDYVLHLNEREYKMLLEIQNQMNMQPTSKLRAAREMLGMAKQLGLPLPRQHFVRAIDYFFKFDAIRYASISCYVGCENLNQNRPHYFKLNQQEDEFIVKTLLASTAIPMVYQPVTIGRSQYRDPMKIENVPLRPLLNEACDTIIIVNLDLNARQKIPMVRQIKGKKIITIAPSQTISNTLQGSLDFSEKAIIKHIELGYQDALTILKQIQMNEDYQTHY